MALILAALGMVGIKNKSNNLFAWFVKIKKFFRCIQSNFYNV